VPDLKVTGKGDMSNSKATVINNNFRFQNAYRNGQSFVSRTVITYVVPRRTGGLRYGITASRKVGCAVERNRARRVIKAAVTELIPIMEGSFELIFVSRKATVESKSWMVRQVLYGHLKKAGVIRNDVAVLNVDDRRQDG